LTPLGEAALLNGVNRFPAPVRPFGGEPAGGNRWSVAGIERSGAVASARRARRIRGTHGIAVYFPLATEAGGQVAVARTVDIVVRTSGDPLAAVTMLRSRIRTLNPRIPVANVRTLTTVVVGATARTSFTAVMLGASSGIALLLGLVGIYGVISCVVSQRTREIGVRMALGASRATVRRMVVRQGLALSAAGVGFGLVAAAPLSRLMRSLLFGVRPIDPLTYIAVGLCLIAVAMLASLIPAVRAAVVDPGLALRND
jgi:predicted lysophospholipase L1 biosynthesis ABC-type transport system permease subunit